MASLYTTTTLHSRLYWSLGAQAFIESSHQPAFFCISATTLIFPAREERKRRGGDTPRPRLFEFEEEEGICGCFPQRFSVLLPPPMEYDKGFVYLYILGSGLFGWMDE